MHLDAEQINLVMCYVIAKSGMTDIMGQITLIEEFTSEEEQESRLGQCLFTLKIAAEIIISKHFKFQAPQ